LTLPYAAGTTTVNAPAVMKHVLTGCDITKDCEDCVRAEK